MEILVYLFVAFIYFIPTIAAYDKRNVGAIFALNLFLGWTAIGWIVALIWACAKDNPSKSPAQQGDPLEQIKKLRALLNEGAITQDEYDLQKKKILKD